MSSDRLTRHVMWLLALVLAFMPWQVRAQYATGGSGQYRNNIIWFAWGAGGTTVPQAGLTKTNTYTVAGQPLVVQCTLSGITGSVTPSLKVYTPGGWRGDALDDLYNIGGTGSNNTMAIGLQNAAQGSSASFTFKCSATYAGNVFPLDGLVFADAETTDSGEYISADISGSPTGTFRLLEVYASCTNTTYTIDTTTAGTFKFGNSGPSCSSANSTQAGPAAIGFLDNVTSAVVTVKGSGLQAVALGVMLDGIDFGDAPATYGSAGHASQVSWTGGTVPPSRVTPVTSVTRATRTPPYPRFGALVDTEPTALSSATATGDDTDLSDDEDGIGGMSALKLDAAGTSYAVTLSCGNLGADTAAVNGWVDFNRNGQFDPAERAQSTCNGVNTTLTWTIPSGMSSGTTFARFRITSSPNAAQISAPYDTGAPATNGEAEDYPLDIVLPVRMSKTWVDAGTGAQASLQVAASSAGAVLSGVHGFTSTADTPNETDADTVPTYVRAGDSYTLSESLVVGSAADYAKSLACTPVPTGSAALTYTADATQGALAVGASATAVACTFTNRGKSVDLSIVKSNNGAGTVDPADDTVQSRTPTVYDIVVSNRGNTAVTGAIVRDNVVSGLDCKPATEVSCSGTGCPSSPSPIHFSDLAAGLVLGTIPSGTATAPSTVTLHFSCDVN